ncbi:MAG: VCBS repeat-containing protein [Alphaproteobacteria bacterium]|nr:VCBS repeat-containing protein [Alphaproteobacteria bacterium]
MAALLPLALLLACTGGDDDLPSTLTEIDGGAGVRVDITDAIGSDVVGLPLRLVNDWGAAVPGGLVGLALDGTGANLLDADVYLDAEGQALAEVRSSEPGRYTVRIASSEDGAETGATADALVLGGPLPDLALDTTLPAPEGLSTATRLARGTGGVAVTDGTRVVWQPAGAGQVAWTVLEPDFEIVGMRSAQVDTDGVLDLVLWGGGQVVVLRGHPTGGYSWGVAWQSPDLSVVGASVSDVDGDQLADITIGLSDAESGLIELFKGDGTWGFTPVSPVELDYRITALVAADQDADGIADVTVVDPTTGWLRRYAHDEDGWTGASPPVLDNYAWGADAQLRTPVDLDGDGILDLLGVSGPSSGSQSVVFFSSLNGWEKYEQAYPTVNLATADVDQDGDVDLLIVDGGLLHRIFWDQETERFIARSTDGIALTGPVVAGDLNGDDVADLAILDDGVVIHGGELDAAGWSIGARSLSALVTSVSGPIALRDIDGDGDDDLIGWVDVSGEPAMQVWRQAADGGFDVTGNVPLNATGDAKEMVYCAPDWYVLVDNQGEGDALPDKAFRIRIDGSSGYTPLKLNGGKVSGEHIACGYPDDPSLRRFTVADAAGGWVTYAYNLEQLDSGSFGGAVGDIALYDPDGDGLDELISCSATGCRLLAEDLDGDGRDELISVDGTLTVDGWGQQFTTTVGGVPGLSDADGDGLLDIVLADAELGRIVLLPTLAGAVAPPVAWATSEQPDGAVYMTDLDGDGSSEAVFLLAGGSVVGTQGSASR